MAAFSTVVGRERELAMLRELVLAVGGGAQRAVALIGEPGIGKTRLLAALEAMADEAGFLVARGRAAELEADLPFALIDDALHAIDPGASLRSGSSERHLAARSVRGLLERTAEARPVALLLDDVHWSDPASSELLSLLLQRPPRGPVLIGIGIRRATSSQLDAVLALEARSESVVALQVGPLSEEATSELLADRSAAEAARLHRESGGNPFYLEELARLGSRGEPAVDEPADAGSTPIPDAVRAALSAEARSLSDEARLVLEAAAVAGDPFEAELAAAGAAVSDEQALRMIDELVAADLVRPDRRSRRFRFRHPVVRNAVYHASPAGWRVSAHERIASALAERGAGAVERAHHVALAARPGDVEAAELLATAADQSLATAPGSAAGWYADASRLLPGDDEWRERRLDLREAQGRALAAAGQALEARELLRDVLGRLEVGSERRIAIAELLADLEALWTANPGPVRELLDAELGLLGRDSQRGDAVLRLAMAYERTHAGDHEAALALAEQALKAASVAGDPALRAAAAVRVADSGHCVLRTDDPAALALSEERLESADRLVGALSERELAERLQMLFWLAGAFMFTGRFERARELGARGLTLARSSGQGLLAPSFVAGIGMIGEELGHLDAASDAAEEALEAEIVTGNRAVGFWASLCASRVALLRGRIDEAIAQGEGARERLGLRPASAAGWTLADALLAAGDPDAALAQLDSFGWANPGLWSLDRLRACEVGVRALLASGRVDEAAELAAGASAAVGGRREGVFGAIDARMGAAVRLARGDAPGAAGVAAAGATAAMASPAPLWAVRCRIEEGRAHIAAGSRLKAREALREAADVAGAAGAWRLRDEAARELRRLGDRPRFATPTPLADPIAGLTPREQEVATLIAEAHTNAQIALQLQLSERTVEKHVSRILGKLGLTSRSEVIRLLSAEGS